MRSNDIDAKTRGPRGSKLPIALDRNIKVHGKLNETLDVVEAQRKKSLENLLQKKQKFLEQTLKRRESIPKSFITKNPTSGTDAFKVGMEDIEKNSHLIALERRASANKEILKPICSIVSAQKMAKKWLDKSKLQKAAHEKIEEENAKVCDDDKVDQMPRLRQKNRRKSLIDVEIETAKLKKQVAFYNHRRRASTVTAPSQPLLESDLQRLEKLGGQRENTMLKGSEADGIQEKKHKEGLSTALKQGMRLESDKGDDSQRWSNAKKECRETSEKGIYGTGKDVDEGKLSQKQKELILTRMKHLNKIKLERKAQKTGHRNGMLKEGASEISLERNEDYKKPGKISTDTNPSKANNMLISNYRSRQINENITKITAGIETAEQRSTDTIGDDVSEDQIKQSTSTSIMNKKELNLGDMNVLGDEERVLKPKSFENSGEGMISEAIEKMASCCEKKSRETFEEKVSHPFKRAALKQRRKSVTNIVELKISEVEGTTKDFRKDSNNAHASEPNDSVAMAKPLNSTKRITQRRKSIASLRGLGGPEGIVLAQNTNTEGGQGGDGLAGAPRRRRSIVSIGKEGLSAGLFPQPDVHEDIDGLSEERASSDDTRHSKRPYGRRKSIATSRSFGDPMSENIQSYGQAAKIDGGRWGKDRVDRSGPTMNRRKSITSLALGGNGARDAKENTVEGTVSKLNNRRRKSIAALPELANRSEFLVCNSFE